LAILSAEVARAGERLKAMIRTYDELKQGRGEQPRTMQRDRAGLQRPDWCSLGTVMGLSGGIIAALAGSLLTALTWFTGTGGGGSYARALGTILLFMTIPLLVCGAHCLDLTEKHKGRRGEARLHEN
jgi:hypothetical protein